MINLFKILFVFTLIYADDGEGPLFTNIIPTADFFYGSSIQIDTQAFDQDGINEIILYYRFSNSENYKNATMNLDINYSTIIPGFEVTSGKIEYYFLGIDEFGNQRKYPENGGDDPLTIPILKQFKNQNLDFYEINLITPLENSKSDDISILILSLYNEANNISPTNIEIILDNIVITDDCNISNELITYVPLNKLSTGSHELIFKLISDEEPFIKKFYFELSKPTELTTKVSENNWMEDIAYSGHIDYSSNYDKINYEDNRDMETTGRPLDVHRLNFNLKSKYKWIDLRSSILFNTHLIDQNAQANKKYNQPIDRFKLGLKFPYGNLNLGDYSTIFSDLTLKGTRVRGLHTSIKIGFFKITYVRGKSRELIQSKHFILGEIPIPDLSGLVLSDSTFLYYEKGTPSRNLRALRTEFDFGKRLNIGFNALTSYDVQDVDVPHEPLYSNYLFIGNSVLGTDGTLFFNNKRTWLSMETAISITNDIREENINNFITELSEEEQAIIGGLEDLLGYSITTDLLEGVDRGRGISLKNLPVEYDPVTDSIIINIDSDYLGKIIKEGTYKIKFKTPFTFLNIRFNLDGEYKRIPSNFVSFGNPSIPKDIQGLSTGLKMNFLNNKVIVRLGYHNEDDNVNDYKLTTTSSIGNNIGMSLNFPKLPNINYAIKYLNRDDEDNVSNTTITHTVTPIYKFNIKNTRIGLNTNFVIMNYYDNLSLNNNNFQQLSVSNSLSLSGNQLSFNIGSGYSNNIPEDEERSETNFLALSSKLSYKLKNNQWSSYIGLNRITGDGDEIKNSKSSIKLGSQYKLSEYSSIKCNLEYLLFSDNIGENADYSEIKGKIMFKINF